MTDTKTSAPKGSTSRATLDTQINLTPVASQTLLVLIAVAGCLFLVCGTAIILAGKNAGWALVTVAGFFIAASLWAWLRSQPDVDLQSSTPTVLSMPNGTTLSTDSRTLRNDGAVDAMLRLIEANQRTVLPQADAIFENGVVVPDSADAARIQSEQINREVLAQAKSLEIGINGPQSEISALQRPSEGITPPDESAASLAHSLAHNIL
jgi:hypothetical protein